MYNVQYTFINPLMYSILFVHSDFNCYLVILHLLHGKRKTNLKITPNNYLPKQTKQKLY